VRTVYKDDGVCNTNCNYENANRRLYYIFTNTDGDSNIEWTDSLQFWQTTNHPDGPYWIKAVAYDEYGNSDAESMLVYLKNGVGVAEEKPFPHVVARTSFQLFPNPSKSDVHIAISGEGKEELEIRIYDASGKLVRTFGPATECKLPYSLIWDRRDDRGIVVSPGAYFIMVRGRSTNTNHKVTILH
jgi:flagellar hook assembly protein FlgD